ncbi:MAG TPA: hypothetical protein VJ597_02790 [Sphingomicrobium sp.]|nr:hypothetical protein [Sphingomicrobium sp.]
MRSAAILALVLAVAPAPSWTQPRITSAYTTLNLDRCAPLDRGDTPEWAEWRCSGYRGVPLFVQSGDDRYDVDAGVADKDEIWADTFDYPGKTVEWRVAAGRPFAIIYRLLPANPDALQVSTLVVETIGSRGKPGCRVAMIPGSAKNANAQARVAADRILRTRPPCLEPQ